MSALDDFFGDGRTTQPECSFCGGKDGELVVTVRDHYGPTHWAHPDCIAIHDAEMARQAEAQNAEIAEWEARDRWEES